MKTFKSLLLIVSVLTLLVSCGDDFTVLAPQSERNVENFYQTDTDFITGINGAYAGLAGNNAYGRAYALAFEMRSDNFANGGGATGLAESLLRINHFTELTTAPEVEDTWAGGYEIIARANTILSRLEGASLDNPALGQRIRGEALFIRSLVYYNLAVIFGNIAIQLDEVTTPNVDINQVSADVIYDQIAGDLAEAEGLLPDSYGGADIGRATSGAAATLLGLVQLTNGNNGEAEAALRRVVNSGQYVLLPNYADLWGAENENNDESIFEIQYKAGGQGTGSSFTEYFSPDFSVSGGVGGGNAPQTLSDDALAAFEEEDERYFGGSFGYTTPDDPEDEGNEYLSKYDGVQFDAFDADNNFIVFRYADVLLMLAEALGDTPEANALINQVRARAGLTTPVESLPGSFEEKLLLERRREFVGENKRWPDLKRFGVAQPVLAEQLNEDENLSYTADDIRLLYPIPQREIDSAPGELEQNPL
ncbi:RagB/SusD family nutrient uptake outer membrane protein [Rhodohalobacter sp. 614A]|uniref:RagB/SusD family nutrient uptake outer membrane protein n=1 Tax=Rhodohalobacter sp. 614A TaxID=2908649 RepID=UPI001F1AD3CF|nr:RagB/SusD family nutrient uptake outer membrane protein [Rhodohalobacter sp. 614A]